MTTEPSDSCASWPLSESAARQINQIRKHLGLNRAQLAERCQQHGAPKTMTAAAVANIETGRRLPDGTRRRDITIDELVIFARALGVPPLYLIFNIGGTQQMEVVPQVVTDTWKAAEWFIGNTALTETETDYFDYIEKALPFVLFREHARLVHEAGTQKHGACDTEDELAEQVRLDVERRRHAGETLRLLRGQMRTARLRPPPLPNRLTEFN